MILFGIFAFFGATSMALSRWATPAVLISVALSVLLGWAVVTYDQFTKWIGLDALLISSWQTLSGMDDPSELIPHCSSGSADWYIVMALSLIGLALALANGLLGLASMVAIPVGAAASALGAIAALFPRSEGEMFRWGIKALAFGVGAAITVGLVLRILHLMMLGTCQ